MSSRFWIVGLIVAIFVGALTVDFPAIGKFVGIDQEMQLQKGLDIQGGTRLIYETDLSEIPEERYEEAAQGVVEVIRRRVDALGVSEPTIQKTGDNQRILVELPGVENVSQAVDLIGETAQLEFRSPVVEQSIDENGSIISQNKEDWEDIGLTGAHFVSANVDFQGGGQGPASGVGREPIIRIGFDSEGADIFERETGEHVGNPIAIFLDDEMISAPTVQNQIGQGEAIISGNFSLEEAQELSIQLSAGALPVPIDLASQTNIGPTLGQESINNSIMAGLIGIFLVILFMLLYYRVSGFVAAVALGYYALVALALFISIPVTITLAGMAGFVLSIGMAVDANVLIFERMKEELRSGRSLLASIDSGFRRAWNSIRDANLSTLITAIILFFAGSGLVKGFALTLGIGIIVSVFTAVTLSQILLRGLAQTSLGKKLWLWGTKPTQEIMKESDT